MSSLQIHSGEIFLEISEASDKVATIAAAFGSVEVHPFLDDFGGARPIAAPALEFTISSDPEESNQKIVFNFRVLGLADIDALRRYCEMAIEHSKSGYLK